MDGEGKKDIKRLASPFIDFPLDLLLQTHPSAHTTSHSYVPVTMATYSVIREAPEPDIVFVCLHGVQRGVTLMTCICGDTSGSLINSRQLEKQSSVQSITVCVCVC